MMRFSLKELFIFVTVCTLYLGFIQGVQSVCGVGTDGSAKRLLQRAIAGEVLTDDEGKIIIDGGRRRGLRTLIYCGVLALTVFGAFRLIDWSAARHGKWLYETEEGRRAGCLGFLIFAACMMILLVMFTLQTVIYW